MVNDKFILYIGHKCMFGSLADLVALPCGKYITLLELWSAAAIPFSSYSTSVGSLLLYSQDTSKSGIFYYPSAFGLHIVGFNYSTIQQCILAQQTWFFSPLGINFQDCRDCFCAWLANTIMNEPSDVVELVFVCVMVYMAGQKQGLFWGLPFAACWDGS